jgi:hypothetical protein
MVEETYLRFGKIEGFLPPTVNKPRILALSIKE